MTEYKVPILDNNYKIPTDKLGSGIANAMTFLRGDQTWTSPLTNLTTDDLTEGVVNKYFPGFTDLISDYGFTDNSSNWNTAYGWGNHAMAGYTSILEVQIFS
jgi:hypothetical protein